MLPVPAALSGVMRMRGENGNHIAGSDLQSFTVGS